MALAHAADGPAPRAPLADVTVEPMRRRHLRAVLAIEAAVYPRPWSPSLFASEIEQPDSRRYLVAVTPSAQRWGRARPVVVGYAGVMLQPATSWDAGDAPEAHVTTVAVHPAHHRRKVGSHLLLGLLRTARRMGAEAATLEVRAANRGAQRLYSGFGFVPVGVRPGYYAETGEDAVIMWAHELQSRAFTTRLERQAARLAEPGGASGAPDLHVPWVKGRIGLDATPTTITSPRER